MEQSPGGTGPPPRPGPSVDPDPSGIVSDYPQEFVDLVGRLRCAETSLHTLRDTPMFTCAKAPIDAFLAQLANAD